MVKTPQLYHSIDADDSARVVMNLFNEGSHQLDNIEFKVDLPHRWTKVLEPVSIDRLAINEEKSATLTLAPPNDVASGKYNVRIRFSGLSNGLPVTTEDKNITIEIKSETSILGTLSILLLIGILIGGVVFYGIKLSKR